MNHDRNVRGRVMKCEILKQLSSSPHVRSDFLKSPAKPTTDFFLIPGTEAGTDNSLLEEGSQIGAALAVGLKELAKNSFSSSWLTASFMQGPGGTSCRGGGGARLRREVSLRLREPHTAVGYCGRGEAGTGNEWFGN